MTWSRVSKWYSIKLAVGTIHKYSSWMWIFDFPHISENINYYTVLGKNIVIRAEWPPSNFHPLKECTTFAWYIKGFTSHMGWDKEGILRAKYIFKVSLAHWALLSPFQLKKGTHLVLSHFGRYYKKILVGCIESPSQKCCTLAINQEASLMGSVFRSSVHLFSFWPTCFFFNCVYNSYLIFGTWLVGIVDPWNIRS